LLIFLECFIGILFLMIALISYRWLTHYQELLKLREKINSKENEVLDQSNKLEILKSEMKSSFAAAAYEALKGSNQEFLKMAEITLGKHEQQSINNLDKKKVEISNLVGPLKETLSQFYKEVTLMEKERQRSYALVESEIQKVIENSSQLSKETRALKDALKKPHIRGRWGEVQLKNCVELAGMSEYSDVTFQDVNDLDGQLLIPDLTVKMPGGRNVVVDAKTPIDAFLTSLESETEEQRNLEMIRHGKQVKEHVKKLSLKSYGERLSESADFTVMFLPNESFLYAALETQPDLVEYALEKQILITTPPTFVGLLKVIRFGWNEEKLNKNADEISKIGKELHKRVADFMEVYFEVGKALQTATDKYDTGLKRLNSRVIVQAKKMESLGAKSHKDLPIEH
jgi:DNA recombination protein RmuC